MTPKPEHTELDEALNGYGAHLTGYDLAPEMDLETAKTAILQHYVPRTEVERLLQEQLEAAKSNLKYQENVTKNERLIRDWKSTIQGIEFCIETLQRNTKADQSEDKK